MVDTDDREHTTHNTRGLLYQSPHRCAKNVELNVSLPQCHYLKPVYIDQSCSVKVVGLEVTVDNSPCIPAINSHHFRKYIYDLKT